MQHSTELHLAPRKECTFSDTAFDSCVISLGSILVSYALRSFWYFSYCRVPYDIVLPTVTEKAVIYVLAFCVYSFTRRHSRVLG